MKKTLFATLALAMVMPAMAADWAVYNAAYSKFGTETETTKEDYTLYLYHDPTESITSTADMTNVIASMTLSEFTAAAGTGYAFTHEAPSVGGDPARVDVGTFATNLSKSYAASSIWGVCVYNGEDAAFLVSGSDPMCASILGKLQYKMEDGVSYTAFKSDSPATPEPATATLSLLALASLASRRRRH